MLVDLMNNPYVWIGLSLITIFSLGFAIYTWIIGRKIKEISIDSYSNEIVRKGKRRIKKLEVKYDGQEVDDVSSIIFYIWNSGNDVINANDMAGENMISIVNNYNQLLEAQIIKQSDSSNAFQITEFNISSVCLDFDYIDAGEGAKIQILYAGGNEDFELNFKIKGGKKLRDCAKLRENRGIKGFVKAAVNESVPIVIMVIGFGIVLFFEKVIAAPREYNLILVLISGGVFSFIVMLIYLFIKSRIQKKFHRAIPAKLKG